MHHSVEVHNFQTDHQTVYMEPWAEELKMAPGAVWVIEAKLTKGERLAVFILKALRFIVPQLHRHASFLALMTL